MPLLATNPINPVLSPFSFYHNNSSILKEAGESVENLSVNICSFEQYSFLFSACSHQKAETSISPYVYQLSASL